MAQPIQAISTYRPRVKKRGVARKDDISSWMADRTLLTEGQARAALSDFAEAAMFYLLNRQDVELEGLGKLSMDINLEGKLTLGLQIESDFVTTQVLDLRGLEQPFHPLPLPKTVGVSRLKWLNRDLGGLNWCQAEQLPDFMDKLDAEFDKSAETIENAENMGKTSAEIYDVWDAEHPDDLVERD